MYGNMTSVEKAMNRPDLEAYKNYDNNQYSLIPGVVSGKVVMNPRDTSANSTHSNNSKGYSPKKSIEGDKRYYSKQKELHDLGYNDQGRRQGGNLNSHGGRNFMGSEQHKNVVSEYNNYARELNDLHAGPANINIGERQRSHIRNQDLFNKYGSSP
jgi:hypothetical protein